MHLRFPERLARWSMVAAIALMLGAPDHWGISWPGAHSHPGESQPAPHAESHSRHCHGDAATCTDLPLTSIGGVAALREWLSVPLAFDTGWPIPEARSLPAGPVPELQPPPPRGARGLI